MIDFYHFGESIRAERLKQGLSQRKLAELSGVSLSSIKRIEKGKQEPCLNVVAGLFKGLGYNLFDSSTWPE